MKKKGFTLIELIAVIVVLAIITLIAVPIISKVVDKARKGAAEASALNYIDAVEKYVILHDLDSTKYPYDLKNNTFNVSSNTEISLLDIIIPKAKAEGTIPSLNSFITVKGDKPKSGTITLNEKGKVTDADLTIGNYSVECENDSCVASGGSAPQVTLSIDTPDSTDLNVSETLTLTVITNSSDSVTWSSSDNEVATVENGVVTGIKPGSVTITATAGELSDSIELNVIGGATKVIGDIYSSANVKQLGVLGKAYLNPISGHIYDDCSTEPNTVGNETSGCMKWYIYAEDNTNNTYTMILDHNISNGVTWGPDSVAYTSSYVYPVVNSIVWDSSIISTGIMSQSDLESITGRTLSAKSYFDGSSRSGTGTSAYSWLYDYTSECIYSGCNYNLSSGTTKGYWIVGNACGSNCVWSVEKNGTIDTHGAGYSSGVRPVIVVPKSIFAN